MDDVRHSILTPHVEVFIYRTSYLLLACFLSIEC